MTLLRTVLSSLALLGSPVLFADESKPADLHTLDAWAEPGAWATAEKLEGSSQEMKWKSVTPGKSILYNGPEGKTTNLTSKASFGDAEMEVEFLIPKGSNSGIYLMSRYEIQILDSYGKADDAISVHDCGAIYERWDESKPKGSQGYEGTPPKTNATSAPGTWQTFRIQFRAPRFDASGAKTENARFLRVEHNGVVIHEEVDVTGPTRGGAAGPEIASAPLIVQGDHGPVAFRKFLVKPAKFP